MLNLLVPLAPSSGVPAEANSTGATPALGPPAQPHWPVNRAPGRRVLTTAQVIQASLNQVDRSALARRIRARGVDNIVIGAAAVIIASVLLILLLN